MLAGAGLVAGTLLALCPGVLRGETLFLRDLALFHRPLRKLLLQLHAASEGIPAWNPFANFGQPFAANPNAGVFDPFSALFFVLPFDLAFNLQVLLPLLIGAAGMAWLLRVRGGSRFAACFGALAWGLGGCALSVSNYLQLHHAVCWLPLAIGLTQRLVEQPNRARAGRLALVLGAIGLAGSPTGLLLTGLVLLAAAWESWPEREGRALPRPWDATGRALLLTALLGAAIAAATLLPAAALLKDSGRAADESFEEEAAGWSLPPVRLLELAAPRAFGHVEAERVGLYWGRELYGWRQWPYFFSLYAGLAALVLGAVGLAAARRGDAPWLLGGGLGLLLAFGDHLPGWELLLRALPPLGLVRFPEKWAVAPSLVLVLFAARGLDLVLREASALRRARAGALALAGLLGLAVGLQLAGVTATRLFAAPSWLALEIDTLALRDTGVQLLLAVLLLCSLFVQRTRPIVLPVLLLALTAVDLVLAGRSLMPTRPPAHYDRAPEPLVPLMSAPAAERRVFLYADWKGADYRRDGMQLPMEAPAPWQWAIVTALEKDFDGTQLAWTRSSTAELLQLMADRPDLVGPLLERRGVAAVLPPPDSPGRAAPLLATRAPRPFAFAPEQLVVRGAEESLPHATARAPGAVILEPGTVLPPHSPGATVGLLELGPERFVLSVRAAEDCLVAVNATWAPGWRASAQGRRLPVLRVDGHLMAVPVPAGEGIVELDYRSAAGGLGLACSLLALVAGLGLATRRAG